MWSRSNQRLRSRYCTVEAIITDRHEASPGISAKGTQLLAERTKGMQR